MGNAGAMLLVVATLLLFESAISDVTQPDEKVGVQEWLKVLRGSLAHNFGRLGSGVAERDTPPAVIVDFPEVATNDGRQIVGQTNQLTHSFYSIPYAKAPVDDLRFMPPARLDNDGSESLINASIPDYVKCYQPGNEIEDNFSEDCLVLNIHVPSTIDLTSDTSDQLLPVMFWIHGGAFFEGAGTLSVYEGRSLSNSTSTVIVSINYRLGALGFLVYDEAGVDFHGNQGLEDQLLALQWVRDNIRVFGGDPNQVTVFGVSAGAQSTMFHLLWSKSESLFQTCIMESNPAVYPYPNPAEARNLTVELISFLDCSDSNGLDCLRSSSATDIIDSTKKSMAKALQRRDPFTLVEPFRPVIDGVEFRDQPLELFQQGLWNTNKKCIVGTNTEELAAFITRLIENDRGPLTKQMFERINDAVLGPDLGPKVAEKYESLISSPSPEQNYIEILSQETADMFFVCPSRILTRFLSSQQPSTYLYSFNHTRCSDRTELCGYAHHGAEVPYVFNTGDDFSEDDLTLSRMFSDYWGSFAYRSIPQSDEFTEWPQYVEDPATKSWPNIRLQSPNSDVQRDYQDDLCDFWDSLDYYVNISAQVVTTDSTTTKDSGGSGGCNQTKCYNLYLSVFLLLLAYLFKCK